MAVSILARSPQIVAAARLMALSWAVSLQMWLIVDGWVRALVFAGVDVALAAIFIQMSQGRFFPKPLAVLHAALAAYHIYTVFWEPSIFWMRVVLNRAFEAALVYILACATFRIIARRLKTLG